MNLSRNRAVRAAGALLTAGLSLGWLLATPALAENLTLTLDSPTEGRRYEASTVTVEGRVDTALLTNVDRVQVIITKLVDGEVVQNEAACAPCGSDSSIPFSFTSSLGSNGPYAVRVVASGHLLLNGIPVNEASAERSFTVVVRPAAPTNLRAERLADNKVRLTWDAVPAYPDLLGYAVFRAPPGGALQPVNGVPPGTTSYIDAQPAAAGGNFEYKVASVRQGAVPGDDSEYLLAYSNLATVNVPPPPVPTTNGVSLPSGSNAPATPATGSDPGPASLDLGQFFNSAGPSGISLPAPSLPSSSSIQLPDTGFDPNLPFGSGAGGLPTERRPATSAPRQPTSAVDAEDENSNRRALLVPVAAGSVLCVAALHLRWLSRRLAVSPLGPDGGADLEPAEPGLEADDLEPHRQPVGAGAGAGPTGS